MVTTSVNRSAPRHRHVALVTYASCTESQHNVICKMPKTRCARLFHLLYTIWRSCRLGCTICYLHFARGTRFNTMQCYKRHLKMLPLSYSEHVTSICVSQLLNVNFHVGCTGGSYPNYTLVGWSDYRLYSLRVIVFSVICIGQVAAELLHLDDC